MKWNTACSSGVVLSPRRLRDSATALSTSRERPRRDSAGTVSTQAVNHGRNPARSSPSAGSAAHTRSISSLERRLSNGNSAAGWATESNASVAVISEGSSSRRAISRARACPTSARASGSARSPANSSVTLRQWKIASPARLRPVATRREPGAGAARPLDGSRGTGPRTREPGVGSSADGNPFASSGRSVAPNARVETLPPASQVWIVCFSPGLARVADRVPTQSSQTGPSGDPHVVIARDQVNIGVIPGSAFAIARW